MTKNKNITHDGATITVTHLDFLRLNTLIKSLRVSKSIDLEYLKILGIELQKAEKIDSKLITPEFVTMNSVMTVEFLDSGRTMELRLVYPQNADFTKGLISVLSPLGSALLGYKAGDVVLYKAPKGELKVRIDKVIYQPEAHGKDLTG